MVRIQVYLPFYFPRRIYLLPIIHPQEYFDYYETQQVCADRKVIKWYIQMKLSPSLSQIFLSNWFKFDQNWCNKCCSIIFPPKQRFRSIKRRSGHITHRCHEVLSPTSMNFTRFGYWYPLQHIKGPTSIHCSPVPALYWAITLRYQGGYGIYSCTEWPMIICPTLI